MPRTRTPQRSPLPVARPTTSPQAWAAGHSVDWGAGSAPAPWDFPPPSFSLAEYDFDRLPQDPREAPAAAPRRLPRADWLHQPHWVRLRRAAVADTTAPTVRASAVPWSSWPPRTLRGPRSRPSRRWPHAVIRVHPAGAFARRGPNSYAVDPADPASVRQLLDALSEDGAPASSDTQWVHALPLDVTGPVGPGTLEHARHTCLDSTAALAQALTGRTGSPRVWWLSYGARPVTGTVDRPELALLAGPVEVAHQESALNGHWLDLPDGDLTRWAATRGLARRRSTPSRPSRRPGPAPPARAAAGLLVAAGHDTRTGAGRARQPLVPAGADTVHLVLGGTGGMGRAMAAWLLEHTRGRVLLLSRSPRLPEELSEWADRIGLVPADLATMPVHEVAAAVADRTSRLDGVIHAAGLGHGGLLVRRDATAMRDAAAVRERGALVVEHLIAAFRPEIAVYCSSMSALLGGVGQSDYAAGATPPRRLRPPPGHGDGGNRPDRHRLGHLARDRNGDPGPEHRQPPSGPPRGRPDRPRRAKRSSPMPWRCNCRSSSCPPRTSRSPEPPSTLLPGPGSVLAVPHRRTPRTQSRKPPTPAPRTEERAHAMARVIQDLLGVDELDPRGLPLRPGRRLADPDQRDRPDRGRLRRRIRPGLLQSPRQPHGDPQTHRGGPHPHRAHRRTEPPPRRPQAPPGSSSTSGRREPVRPSCAWCTRWAGTSRPTAPWWRPSAPRRRCASSPTRHCATPRCPRGHWPSGPSTTTQRYANALADRTTGSIWPGGPTVPAWRWRWRASAESADRAPEALYLLDPPPPQATALVAAYDETHLERVFAAELGTGASSAPNGHGQAYAERLARCCRANLRSLAEHRVRPLVSVPTYLWLAENPTAGMPTPAGPRESDRQWSVCLPASAVLRYLPTHHYGIVAAPHVDTVAETIRATLASPDASTRENR